MDRFCGTGPSGKLLLRWHPQEVFFFFPILFALCLVSVKFGQTKEIFGSLPSTMKLLFGFSESLFNSKEKKNLDRYIVSFFSLF